MLDQTLKIRVFHMDDVELADRTHVEATKLQVNHFCENNHKDIKEINIQLIQPNQLEIETNTIMDIIPISTKVLGELGRGITHTLTGVYVLMTGAIEDGEQMHEFGSSEGVLAEHLKLNQHGTPGDQDYLIHIDLLAFPDATFDRELCMAMFQIVDRYIQDIREQLKMLDGRDAVENHEFTEKRNIGKPKVALVKQIAGQGAMYDNMLFPNEPSGFVGGQSIIDMNNMPILLSANEYRDGAIRAMV